MADNDSDMYANSPHLSDRAKELLQESFLNEEHIAAFAEALQTDELLLDDTITPTNSYSGKGNEDTTSGGVQAGTGHERRSGHSRRPSMHGSVRSMKLERIKSLSDFAPVNSKVSRPKSRASRSGLSYHLVRWPLLGLIFLVIYLEFGMYIFTRQLVNSWEWFGAYTGRGLRRRLRRKLRNAKSWEEWKDIANEMDRVMKFDEWKNADDDPSYDYPLVRKVRRSLINLRNSGDVRGLMNVLEICLRHNFAGTEGPRIYSETFYGTKKLVESYVKDVRESLEYVRTNETLSLEEKRRFFRGVNKNFGASALCLSGGAGFGYYHFGVIKAFLEADLLPRVVTGTSAGGLVAALTCTRTDDELRELLVPELANRITACEDGMSTWLRRAVKTGARFDTVAWAQKATFFTRGSLTFREAYERTGRALNISVIPHDRHSPTKLLNYLTAPDCIIWSAIIASAAVPGILNSVVLMQKTKDGVVKPMNWGSKYKDGSLRVDIPLQSLHLLFNVNFSIVSQVNPHIHLFFFAPQGSVGKPVMHRKGKGWRGGFLLSAAEQYLKLELTKNFRVIRDLELLPILLGQDWSGVFLQRFDGNITIWPRTRFMDWMHLLTDPNPSEMEIMLKEGSSVSWPKLHMVENRLQIERSILRGRTEIRQAMHRREVAKRQTNANTDGGSNGSRNTSVEHGQSLQQSSGQQQQQHFPLESDAEGGFADRSRLKGRYCSVGQFDNEDPDTSEMERSPPQAVSTGLRKRRGKLSPLAYGHDAAEKQSSGSKEFGEIANAADLPLSCSEDAESEGEDEKRTRVSQSEGPNNHASQQQSGPARSRTRSFPGFTTSFSGFGFRRQDPIELNDLPEESVSPSAAGTPSRNRLSRWLSPPPKDQAVEPDRGESRDADEEELLSESSSSDDDTFENELDDQSTARKEESFED